MYTGKVFSNGVMFVPSCHENPLIDSEVRGLYPK
jgi:hypothetical protein